MVSINVSANGGRIGGFSVGVGLGGQQASAGAQGGVRQGMTGFSGSTAGQPRHQRVVGPVAGPVVAMGSWRSRAGTGTPASRSGFAAGATRFLRAGVVAPAMLAVAALMGSAGTAAALEIPKFDPQVEVYTVGDRTQAGFDKTIVKAATDADGDKTYVVVYDSISENDRDFLSLEENLRYNPDGSEAIRTNQAGRLIQKNWRKQGLDGNANIVVFDTNDMSYQPGAQVGITPGSNWDTLGFNNEKINFERMTIDVFGPKYRAGDREGATADMVHAIDQKIEAAKSWFDAKIESAEITLQHKCVDQNSGAVRKLVETLGDAKDARTKKAYVAYAQLGKDLADQSSLVADSNAAKERLQQQLSELIASAADWENHPEFAFVSSRVGFSQALAGARVAVNGSNPNQTRTAHAALQELNSRVKADITALTDLHHSLEFTISRVNSILSHSHLTQDDNTDLLKEHLEKASQLVRSNSHDHDRMRSVLGAADQTGTFLAEIERLESLLGARVELAFQIEKTRGDISREIQATNSLLNDNVDLLNGKDVSAYERAVRDAQRVLDHHADGKDLSKLKTQCDNIVSKNSKLAELLIQLKAEAAARQHLQLAFGGFLAAAMAVLGMLGRRYYRRRKDLEDQVSDYEQDILDAETQLAKIVWEGDQSLETILGGVVEASKAYMNNRSGDKKDFNSFTNQSFEGVFKAIDQKSSTGAKFAEYLKLKDELEQGLKLFKKHVSKVRAMSWVQLGKVEEKFKKFKQDEQLSTDQLAEDLASSRRAEANAINPVKFWEDLEGKFDAFKQVKAELDAALVVISKNSAEQDFALTEYAEMETQLEQNGITKDWLKEHPLFDNAKAKWNEWDALRQSDPLEYQKTIAAEKLRQESIKNNIKELIHQAQRVKEAKARLEQSEAIDYSKTEITDDKFNPQIAEAEAVQSFGELQAALQAPQSLFINEDRDALADVIENFVKLADTATDKYEEVLQRKTVLQEIMENVAGRVQRFEKEFAEKKERFAVAQHAAEALSANHDESSRVKVLSEIQQATEDLEKAKDFLSEANSALDNDNHVLAEDRAKQALGHIRDANIDIDDIWREVQALEKNRADYAVYYQSLSDVRAQKITQMSSFAPYNDEKLLGKGDQLKQEMPANSDVHGKAANWAEMLARLKQVNELWDRGVKTAENLKTVDRVDDKIDGLEEQLNQIEGQVREVDLDHNDQAMQQLYREIQEARDAVTRADEARDQAVALKGQAGKDADARSFADKAAALQARAQKEIQDVENEIRRLQELRQNYLRKREEVYEARSRYLSKMRNDAGHFYDESHFNNGDRLFDHHANPALAREVNYALLITQLDEVSRSWDSAVDRAVRRYRDYVEEQERIAAERRRREREEEERRAEERRRRERAAEERRAEERRRSSSSSFGGGGNRGGGSSFGGGGNRGGGANF